MNVTKLEISMLNKIVTSEYQSTTVRTFGDCDAVWASCIIENSEDKGVFSSLLKKKLVTHYLYDENEDEYVCRLTREGFEVWKANTAN